MIYHDNGLTISLYTFPSPETELNHFYTMQIPFKELDELQSGNYNTSKDYFDCPSARMEIL